jgi:hypothetical protein
MTDGNAAPPGKAAAVLPGSPADAGAPAARRLGLALGLVVAAQWRDRRSRRL